MRIRPYLKGNQLSWFRVFSSKKSESLLMTLVIHERLSQPGFLEQTSWRANKLTTSQMLRVITRWSPRVVSGSSFWIWISEKWRPSRTPGTSFRPVSRTSSWWSGSNWSSLSKTWYSTRIWLSSCSSTSTNSLRAFCSPRWPGSYLRRCKLTAIVVIDFKRK